MRGGDGIVTDAMAASFALMSFHVPAAVGQGGKQDAAWAVSQVKVNTPDAPYAGLNPRTHDHWRRANVRIVCTCGLRWVGVPAICRISW